MVRTSTLPFEGLSIFNVASRVCEIVGEQATMLQTMSKMYNVVLTVPESGSSVAVKTPSPTFVITFANKTFLKTV